ncbi:RIP metalloprotease RseP [Salibacter halophilus]|uniref:Zinc metalloprotease n=1 Tax=Salibacter halophilus TaxID=1803916 RepID=A0A6N6M768_9FLAO|nr:RIP metalloprotease RseP [Salibacter halophilus]KAB1063906.1 RIP metalloprotease RseP [Salibacter halophilus]
MDDILIKAAQLLLSLSILVILHEFGHFLPAKLFGVKVEKFYLFFDPWFSLFKTKKGDTEYGVGWLPLGGYVKLSGMIDESMDKEQMKEPAKDYEFRAKPAWQRLIVMLGGVTVNVILGIFIYSMIMMTWGKTYLSAEDAKYGVHVSETAKQAGFKDGDRVIEIDGEPLPNDYTYATITQELLLNEEINEVTVENNGQTRTVRVPHEFAQKMLASGEKSLFTERIPFIADTVLPSSPAESAGIQKGDKFLAVNGKDTEYFIDFAKTVQDLKGEEVEITVERNGEPVTLSAMVGEDGKVGVGNQPITNFFELTQKDYSFFEAFPAGYNLALDKMGGYIDQFSLIFSKEGVSQLGGFGTIGNLFPSAWDWRTFWNLTAFLSLILAIMNILPIPALDGGHVMFLLYEIVSGRKPGEKFMEYAQLAGMLLLLTLLLWANGNDVLRMLD